MSIIHMDGFDSYTTLADLSAEYVISTNPSVSLAGGRYGGGAVRITNTGQTITRIFSPLTELWLGCAINISETASNPGGYLALFSGSAGTEFSVTYYVGTIKLFRGTAGGTIVGTYSATISFSTWHWLEIRYKYHASAGVCEVWLDGVQIVSYSGNSTSSASGSVNQWQIGGSNYVYCYFDDLYILDATTAPNTSRLGDSRIETLVPTGNGATNNGTATGVASLYFGQNGASSLAVTNAYLYESPAIAAPLTGTLNGIELFVNTIGGGNSIAAVYDNSGNVLATSAQLTAIVLGWNYYPFVVPLSVTAGTLYRIAFQFASSGNYVMYAASGANWTNKNISYTVTFPTNPNPVTSMSGAVNFAWAYAPTANYQCVTDQVHDENGYVTITSASGQEELYTVGALSSAAYVVSGVRLMAIDQKLDAGPSLLKMVAVSGGSEGASVGIPTLTSWSRQYAILETDPHTSAAWTAAAVNSAQYGVKVA